MLRRSVVIWRFKNAVAALNTRYYRIKKSEEIFFVAQLVRFSKLRILRFSLWARVRLPKKSYLKCSQSVLSCTLNRAL